MKVGVGTSYEEVNPAFVNKILPLADIVEVIPESLAIKQEGQSPKILEETLRSLAEIAEHATIIVHGVGLSIGSSHGWNNDYFRLLDQILETVKVAWHSEHLGFVNVSGSFLGTMLSLPRSQEALDLVSERARLIVERYPLPFLLENIVNLLPDPPADMSDAAFLNQLSRNSGCRLLLDLYNLECNACNQRNVSADFLGELDMDLVGEIHVAGGVTRGGLMLDIHSRPTHPTTRALLPGVLSRSANVKAIIYEVMPQAVPVLGWQAWTDELQFLRSVVAEHES